MKSMKQLGMIVVMCVITITSFAQENKQGEIRKQKAQAFAELAAEEFNLTKDQQTALFERKIQHFEEQQAIKKKAKKMDLSEEEKKAPNKSFGKYFRKLTGKTYKELKPFYDKVGKKMKKIN